MAREYKPIVALWSGGIDSTALIAALLNSGRDVKAVSVDIYKSVMPQFAERERTARQALRPHLDNLRGSFQCLEQPGEWIWAFHGEDRCEIPRRNRILIDYIVAKMPGLDSYELALGEYIGADSWVVQDHVDAADADARALTAYLYREHGLKYRLWTLADVANDGEARFKSMRLRIGIEHLGVEGMALTTNCLTDLAGHCGKCYKCVERRAAWALANIDGYDPTLYVNDPKEHPHYERYVMQQQGQAVPAVPVAVIT